LTCIGPYIVVSTAPVTVRVAVDPPEPAVGLAPGFAFVFMGEAAELAFAFAGVVADAAGVAPADAAAGEAPGSATSATDEWVLNESSAASPAAVLPRVKMARRMRSPRVAGQVGSGRVGPGQKSKDSRWMRRDGMPAARSAVTAVWVMPGGPHT
jgi:hypothetical protein